VTSVPQQRRGSPLLYPAVFLSLASLAWTTWSLVDLLGTGWIGFTVAAGSDIVWGSVIIAEARGLRIAGRSWIVPTLGWTTLLIVAAFLASHGIARESIAMAAAGPFLPLGAKVVWALALADMRDPAALTHDELHQLAGMERGMVFEEREHDIRMRQQRMRADLLMSEVSTDFEIEAMRQDRARELRRRAPLAISHADAPGFDTAAEQAVRIIRPEPDAQVTEPQAHHGELTHHEKPTVVISSQVSTPEPTARPADLEARPFGFSAHLNAQSIQRAQAVQKVAELVAQDPGLTSAQVVELLAVSPATAKRYLREARQGRRP
jgi:hypothetical protein